jgi:hypothetical protein
MNCPYWRRSQITSPYLFFSCISASTTTTTPELIPPSNDNWYLTWPPDGSWSHARERTICAPVRFRQVHPVLTHILVSLGNNYVRGDSGEEGSIYMYPAKVGMGGRGQDSYDSGQRRVGCTCESCHEVSGFIQRGKRFWLAEEVLPHQEFAPRNLSLRLNCISRLDLNPTR